MKFKLQRNNKYVGKRIKKVNDLKERIATGALSVAFVVACYINFIIPLFKDYSFEYVAINAGYSLVDDIMGTFSDYDKMSKEDKCQYVTELFCNAIDKNNDFSVIEKDELKENLSLFLGDWGYLYDSEVLRKLEIALFSVDVEVNANLSEEKNALGVYWPNVSKIVLDCEDDISTLNHETTHVISTDPFNYAYFNCLIREGITSSIDEEYYGAISYTKMIRNQVLFLSEIVGKENLIRCYVNSDYNYLNQLVGEDNYDLFDMFNEEYLALLNKDYDSYNDICGKVAGKLKDMYEDKYDSDISKDVIMNVIYLSCFSDEYDISSTMFYKDKFKFSLGYDEIILDVCNRGNSVKDVLDYYDLMLEEDFLDYNVGVCDSIRNFCLSNSIKNLDIGCLDSLRLMLPEDIYYDICYSDDVFNELKKYLVECGFEEDELNRVIYKVFNKGSLSDKEVSLLYYNKFKYLYDNDRLEVAISDIKMLVGCDRADEILNSFVDKSDYFDKQKIDCYLGFYWRYKNYNSDDSSILGYYRVFDNEKVILPDIGIDYNFYDVDGVVFPESINFGDEFVIYEFDGDLVLAKGNEEGNSYDIILDNRSDVKVKVR